MQFKRLTRAFWYERTGDQRDHYLTGEELNAISPAASYVIVTPPRKPVVTSVLQESSDAAATSYHSSNQLAPDLSTTLEDALTGCGIVHHHTVIKNSALGVASVNILGEG